MENEEIQNRRPQSGRLGRNSADGDALSIASLFGAGYISQVGRGGENGGTDPGTEGGGAGGEGNAYAGQKDKLDGASGAGTGNQKPGTAHGADPGAGAQQLAIEGGSGLSLCGEERTYLVVGSNGGEVEYSYRGGLLSGVAIKTEMSWAAASYIWQNLKGTEALFKQWLTGLGKAVQLVTRVPSFEDFWAKQRRKEKKIRAEREWGKLSDAQKQQAYMGLTRFFAKKSQTTEALPYPEMYLKDRRWEDGK